MNNNFEQILDQCLTDLHHNGDTIESCLARYPEQAVALRPLLEMATLVHLTPVPQASARAIVNGRNQMLDAVSAQYDTAPVSKLPFSRYAQQIIDYLTGKEQDDMKLIPRLAIILLALALLIGGWGTTAASATAIPGDLLYPVKTAVEGVRLLTAADRAQVEEELQNTRLQEIQTVLQTDRIVKLSFAGTLTDFDEDAWIVAGVTVQVDENTSIQGEPAMGAYVQVNAITTGDGTLTANSLVVLIAAPHPTHTPPPATHVPHPTATPPGCHPAHCPTATHEPTHVPPTPEPTHCHPAHCPTATHEPTHVPPTPEPTHCYPGACPTATHEPTHVPPTHEPTHVPPTHEPTHVPPTHEPTHVPPTHEPTPVPPTHEPTHVPPSPTTHPPTATPTPDGCQGGGCPTPTPFPCPACPTVTPPTATPTPDGCQGGACPTPTPTPDHCPACPTVTPPAPTPTPDGCHGGGCPTPTPTPPNCPPGACATQTPHPTATPPHCQPANCPTATPHPPTATPDGCHGGACPPTATPHH